MIIHLDIDGVLNRYSKIKDDILAIAHPHNPGTFCKKNLDAFKKFLSDLDEPYTIYINSTWMYYHSEEVIREAFVKNGFDGSKIFMGVKVPAKSASQLARMRQNQPYAKVWTIDNFIKANPELKERIISLDDIRLWKAHRNYFKDTLNRVEYFQTNPNIGFDEIVAEQILTKKLESGRNLKARKYP